MKSTITLLIALLISISTFAQQSINYKAIIKDDLGNVIANTAIVVQFTIYEGDALTNQVYIEQHAYTTDGNGFVILNIGEGNTIGNFNAINWGSDVYFLNVQVNVNSGGLIDLGTTQFMAVPYAKYAESVKNQGFKSEDGITHNDNLTDSFVFGSTQLDDNGTSSDNSIMFFDRGKASFRAGRVLDDKWSADNVGNRSAAFGLNTVASGTYSVATGNRTLAESQSSVAIGAYNVGGGNPTTWVGTDPLFEIGNGTATISTETRKNALTVLKNGNIGIGFDSENPTQALDVVGKIKVANDVTAPTPGTIRYNQSNQAFEGYTSNVGWVTLGAKKPEKTIVIPASQFVGTLGTNVRIIYSGSTVYLATPSTSGNSATPGSFITAPIVMPVGSKIVSISYVFEDNNPLRGLDFIFSKYCGDLGVTSETETILNLHVVSGLESPNLFRYTYPLNETIELGCQYSISVGSTNGWGFDGLSTGLPGLKFHKIYIEYSED